MKGWMDIGWCLNEWILHLYLIIIGLECNEYVVLYTVSSLVCVLLAVLSL